MIHKIKLGLMGATALAGITLMSSGSYAIFTASAATASNQFAAGVVDLTATDSGAAATSQGGNIPLTNMVPGDTTSDIQYVYNKGTVTEYVSVDTNASGDIFFDDGLNNPAANTNGVIATAYQPVGGMNQYSSSGNNPVLASPAIVGGDYVSVDYAKTNNNSLYENDSHPFQYTVSAQVQVSTDGGKTWTAAGNFTTEDGSPVNLASTSNWGVWYQPLGDDAAKSGLTYPSSIGAYSASTAYSGTTNIYGIILPPSTVQTGTTTAQYRLAITYGGTLPILAHNDYQETVGSMQSTYNAWQWENGSGAYDNTGNGLSGNLSTASSLNAGGPVLSTSSSSATTSTPTSLSVTGAGSITVPTTGSVSVYNYQANVLDQNGVSMTGQTANWSVSNNSLNVTMNSTTGALSIPAGVSGTVTVTATDGSLTGSESVTITSSATTSCSWTFPGLSSNTWSYIQSALATYLNTLGNGHSGLTYSCNSNGNGQMVISGSNSYLSQAQSYINSQISGWCSQ